MHGALSVIFMGLGGAKGQRGEGLNLSHGRVKPQKGQGGAFHEMQILFLG